MSNLNDISDEQLVTEIAKRFDARRPRRLADVLFGETEHDNGVYYNDEHTYDFYGTRMLDVAVGMKEVERLRNLLSYRGNITVWEIIELAADRIVELTK